MPKLKRQGIEFYTLHTDYLHSRAVRRIMKREGEAAVAVLLETYSAIYAGEGYYVQASPKLFDDLADLFFHLDADAVKRVLEMAVENELFDAELYRQYGILTSAGIQSEFLYATRRRSRRGIDPRYLLLPADEEARAENGTQRMPAPKAPDAAETTEQPAQPVSTAKTQPETPAEVTTEKSAESPQMYTGMHQMYTFTAEKRSLAPQSTHTTQHDTTLHHTETPLLNGSPGGGGTGEAGRKPAEGVKGKDLPEKEKTPPAKPAGDRPRKPIRQWTPQDIAALCPPSDGRQRNLDGLKFNLLQWRIPPEEQYAIICKSNFGVIGHPVWRGFFTLRESHGKIRQPGRYLLSLC